MLSQSEVLNGRPARAPKNVTGNRMPKDTVIVPLATKIADKKITGLVAIELLRRLLLNHVTVAKDKNHFAGFDADQIAKYLADKNAYPGVNIVVNKLHELNDSDADYAGKVPTFGMNAAKIVKVANISAELAAIDAEADRILAEAEKSAAKGNKTGK